MPGTAHAPTYLIKNPYSYCFRIKVPKDLQPTLSRKELRYSLKTGNLPEAKIKARLLAGQAQLIYKRLRKGLVLDKALSDSQLQEMIKKYMQGLIKEYDQPARHNLFVDEAEWNTWASEEDAVRGTIDILDEEKAQYNTKLHSGDYYEVEPEADRLLAELGLDGDIDKGSSTYSKLCSGILRAKIKGVEYQQKKLSGEFSDDLENALGSCLLGTVKPTLQPPDTDKHATTPTKPNGKIVSEIIPLFVAETKVRWEPKTKSEVGDNLLQLQVVSPAHPVQAPAESCRMSDVVPVEDGHQGWIMKKTNISDRFATDGSQTDQLLQELPRLILG